MKLLSNKRYEEMQNELLDNEIEIHVLNKRLDLKTAKIDELEKKQKYMEEQSESFVSLRQELREKIKEYKKLLKAANGAKGGLKKENNKLNNELYSIMKKQEQYLKNNDELRKNNKNLNNENSELKAKLLVINNEKSKLQNSLIQLNEKNKILSSKKNQKSYLRGEERKIKR